jgi:protease-4
MDKGLSVSGEKFGVVRVEGVILDSRKVNEWMRKLREDSSVLGVLLRVNSPGGAVAPAQEIYMGVKRLAEVKPVVVSMSSVAASGGYYVSAPAHKIVANPATITGSIGVKMELSNVQELMQKIGISHQSLVSGDFKDAGSPFKPMTDEERDYLKGVVMDLHRQFVHDVAEGRKMDLESVLEVADGRIFTGKKAERLGLVDELGDTESAFSMLKEMCQVKEDLPIVEGPKEEKPLLRELLGFELNTEAVFGPRWQFLFR